MISLDDSWTPEPTSGCWLWTRALMSTGYGHLSRNGKYILAHRWVYEQLVSPIPEGMYLCHHCDNPPCVNPSHMFIGTGKDNMRDCARKGRALFQKRPELTQGTNNGRARFTEQEVRTMHRLRRIVGLTDSQIARVYEAPTSTIHSALNVHWAHIRAEFANAD